MAVWNFRIPVDQPLGAVDEAASCRRTKNSETARDRPSSMVKRSRDQSQEAPSLRNWRPIVPPDSSFHAQTSLRNASRPISRRPGRFSAASLRSTTICVAIPA